MRWLDTFKLPGDFTLANKYLFRFDQNGVEMVISPLAVALSSGNWASVMKRTLSNHGEVPSTLNKTYFNRFSYVGKRLCLRGYYIAARGR